MDLFTPGVGSGIDFNFGIKLLFFVILLFYVLYSFLIVLRVRILADTVETPHNKFIILVTWVNLLISIIGGFLAMILILTA